MRDIRNQSVVVGHWRLALGNQGIAQARNCRIETPDALLRRRLVELELHCLGRDEIS
jgi:hypothetical protein